MATAAVVLEPILGEGGFVVPAPGFLRRVADFCAEHGILLVADEVQSGMGRTGKMFACEHFDLDVDIVTVAKGIASGMPLGVTISKAEIMDWVPGSHASTFGGNPVCIAAAGAACLIEAYSLFTAREATLHLPLGLPSIGVTLRLDALSAYFGLIVNIGVAAVESTQTTAPTSRARSLAAAMSVTSHVGFAGVSIQISRGRRARVRFARSSIDALS